MTETQHWTLIDDDQTPPVYRGDAKRVGDAKSNPRRVAKTTVVEAVPLSPNVTLLTSRLTSQR